MSEKGKAAVRAAAVVATTALGLAATLVEPAEASDSLVAPAPSAAALTRDVYLSEAAAMEAYLWRHVLEPRFPRCVDRERGGFHATYTRDWSPQPDHDRFIVYQARVTWTAAEVAHAFKDRRPEYEVYVRHGVRTLADVMWDKRHGGFFTSVGLDGTPVEPAVKWTYGNAFGVYALASVYRATGDPEALALARNGFEWMEKHLRTGDAYLGGVQRDGTRLPFDELSVSPAKDAMGAPSAWLSMNVHIHVLEAYAELLRAAPDPRVRERTRAVLHLLRDRFVADPGNLHLFLTEDGRPIPGHVSFGHDFETGFLFHEAEAALGEADPRTARAARRLVDHSLAWGFDKDTGQVFERGFALDPPFDKGTQWWSQFETFNVLALMHERYGRETPVYGDAFLKAWRFVRERLTDEEHRGVYLGLDENGKVRTEKSGHWFVSYHTTRSLLLTAERLRRLARESR